MHLLLLRLPDLVNPELSFTASGANGGLAAFQKHSSSSPPVIQLIHHFLEIPSTVCQKSNPSQGLASASADGTAKKVVAGWRNIALTSCPLKFACLVPSMKV